MTDFHKLLMVKINKMIRKETGGIFLVVFVYYGSLVFTDSKKTVFCSLLDPTVSFILYNYGTFKR